MRPKWLEKGKKGRENKEKKKEGERGCLTVQLEALPRLFREILLHRSSGYVIPMRSFLCGLLIDRTCANAQVNRFDHVLRFCFDFRERISWDT